MLTARRLLLAAALLLAWAGSAHAHARLLAAIPKDHALLAGSPKQVELWFNELLENEFNSIEVFSSAAPTGAEPNLASGPATVDPDNRTHLVAPLGKLPPGAYVIHWKVLSRDGHSALGRLEFRIVSDRRGAY